MDGADEVRLFGETVAVNAHIETLAGVSGHADNAGLMRWISAFEQKPRHVFVVHGEDEVAAAFAARLESELGLEANAPYNGESWDLISLTRLSEGNRERLRRPSREAAALDALPSRRPPAHAAPERKAPDASTAYGQLVLAGEKLSALIRRMQGRGAKQQSRLARQINPAREKVRRPLGAPGPLSASHPLRPAVPRRRGALLSFRRLSIDKLRKKWYTLQKTIRVPPGS